MKKILFLTKPHDYLAEHLTSNGCHCVHHPNASFEQICSILPDFHGVIVRSHLPVNKQFIDTATQLEFIARVGIGMEHIDETYAASKNIACFNSPEGSANAVAEHALGMLLSLFNHLNRADKEVRAGKWLRESNRGIEIKGKTIGIIGYGNIGQAFAKILSGFDAHVIAYDKYKSGFGDNYSTEVSLQTVFEQSDVISLHIPFAEDNRYFFNNNFINNCHKKIYVINTARGKVLNTADLVKNMKSGKVLGAALDVIEYEGLSFEGIEAIPTDFQYLLDSDQTILSPHIAGWTEEAKLGHAKVLAAKIVNERFMPK